jgi:tape measure domain-containing protein
MNGDVGSIEYVARINTKNLKSDATETESIIDNVGKNTEASAARGEKGFLKMGAAIGVVAGIAQSVMTKAIDSVTSSIDSAIKRVDTLNNSERTFKNMGFAAEDTKKAMESLEKSIKGLPTSLDEGVRGIQMIAAATNDVQKSQKIFAALNNGILGFGGSAFEVSNAVKQLSQDLAGGRIQAETWNSLLDSGLGPALSAIARQMGKTTKELKTGLSEGTISAELFTDKLIEMNEKGGGGMASLEKIAKDSTSGISTGFANMRTAITRGVAAIITSLGSDNLSGTISSIGDGFESALKSIANFIPKLKEVADRIADYLAPKLTALWTTIRDDVIPAIKNFADAFGPTGGAALVGLVGLAVDSLNALLTALTPVINYMAENTSVVYAMVGAFVAIKTALAINAAVVAFQAALAAAVASMGTTAGAAGGLRLALLALAGPWQIAIAVIGVGAAVAAINEIWKVLQKVGNAIDDVNKKKVKVAGAEVSGDVGMTAQLRNFFSGRASGGPVLANTPYLVGENRDGSLNDTTELFVPGKSGSIMNSKDLQAALGGSGGGTEYNIGVINIAKEVDGEKWLRKLTKNQQIVSSGLVPTQAYM